jgi:hypothetical protein
LQQEGNELPAVIIGDKILGGEPKIRKELEGLVKYGINFFFFIVASKLQMKAITEWAAGLPFYRL